MGGGGRLVDVAACVELLLSGGGCAGGMILAFEFFLVESRKRDWLLGELEIAGEPGAGEGISSSCAGDDADGM